MRNVAIRKDEKDSYLRLCHEITMKNLHQSTLDIIEQEKGEYSLLTTNENGYELTTLLGTTPSNKSFNIFNCIYYAEYQQGITLYEYKESYIIRAIEMDRIIKELNNIYKVIRENPISLKTADFVNRKNLLEDRYLKLSRRTTMTDEDKYIANVQNRFAKLFEGECGIRRKKDYDTFIKPSCSIITNDRMHMVFEKEMPALTLKKEITYY